MTCSRRCRNLPTSFKLSRKSYIGKPRFGGASFNWCGYQPFPPVRRMMGSSNRALGCKRNLALTVCLVQGRLRGRHEPPHVGSSRTEPSYVDGALGHEPVHPIKRNGSAHVPAGTERARCLLRRAQAVTPAERSNSSPDFSMACMMTASLRATATAARLKPIRSRSLRPQSRSVLSAELRVRMTVAASYK